MLKRDEQKANVNKKQWAQVCFGKLLGFRKGFLQVESAQRDEQQLIHRWWDLLFGLLRHPCTDGDPGRAERQRLVIGKGEKDPLVTGKIFR